MSKYLIATCTNCGGACDFRASGGRCHKCRPRRPAIDRISDRITIDDNGCWVWPGAKTPGGYGQVHTIDGARLTHRITYEHFVGPVPNGKQLDHLCRVRACCNPDHLEPVTQQENIVRGYISRGIPATAHPKERSCVVCGAIFSLNNGRATTCGNACRCEAGRRAAFKRWVNLRNK